MKVALGVSALLKGLHGQGIDGIGIYSQQLLRGLLRTGMIDVLPCSHNFADEGFEEQKL